MDAKYCLTSSMSCKNSSRLATIFDFFLTKHNREIPVGSLQTVTRQRELVLYRPLKSTTGLLNK